ncbi:MAG: cupin domain-containing protein [Acidimicrobiia bacterium]|nr:cupin domain-containing protein [Acidimicrobiia bacterium]
MTTEIQPRPAAATEVAAVAPPTAAHQALWMLNSLLIERATADDTGGAYTVHEQWITPAGNPPPHVHRDEDEAFLVLSGSVEVTVGDTTVALEPGGFAFGPRGVAHTYAVTSEVAHLLVISSPAGAERFFRAVGEQAGALTLPDPAVPDVAAVVTTAARHGITVVPPPA